MNHRTRVMFFVAALSSSLSAHADGVAPGQHAPNCALKGVHEGQQLNLKDFQGQVVYVDFWASWCGPCAQSFPFMNHLNHELGGKGLKIIGVNLDEEPDEAKDFLAKRPAHFHVAMDHQNSCAQSFGVKAMPSSYLVDRKGVVRHVHLGFRPGEAQKMQSEVEQLLAEAPPTR